VPTLEITDTSGFVDIVHVNPSGALNKYFKPLPGGIAISILNLKDQGDGKLDKIASVQAGLDLGTTAQLGAGNKADLDIKATASGTISILSPAAGKPATLFDSDQFADPITVEPNQRYLSVAFNATVEADASSGAGDLKFGFKGSSGVTLSYYQPFDVSQTAPTLVQAIESAIANFSIPGDLDDVAAMPPNSVAAVDGAGDLKFSGTVTLASLTNAPVSLPLGAGPVQITAGGKFSLAASFELSGEYQVRVQRLAGSLFHLGLYRKKKTEITLTASASGGLSASLGQDDLFGKILQAISSDPKADKAALAGLPPARVAEIQNVIKQAVDRTLNIGVTEEVGFGSDSEAMFLYEIDLSTITVEGRPLIHSALEGDLGPLVSTDLAPPPGIKVLKTLISSAKALRHSLKVNLLGIYNFARVSELTLKGAQAWDATTGELVLTDTATASLIGINTSNFAADSKKLRRVLSEQFLISAAYTASGVIKGPPGLQAQHSYFNYSSSTSPADLRNDLLLGAAFQLISRENALGKLPAGIKNFNTTTVFAETAYDDAAAEAIFLDNNQPRNAADYESAGRLAITYLVQKGDDDDYRLLPVTDDNLWSQMKQNGNVNSPQWAGLIQNYTQAQAAPSVIGVDYLNIVWWSGAMQSCAQALVQVRTFLSQNPGVDPNNQDFLAQKRDLAERLQSVEATTREDFGGPWGLIAMCLLATKVASVAPNLFITNQYVSVDLEKAVSA